MERKTITIKQFKAKYGFSWRDILHLGWFEDISEDAFVVFHGVCKNNCPVSKFFYYSFRKKRFEIYEDMAPLLAEILTMFEETETILPNSFIENTRFHCFSLGDEVFCVTRNDGEDLSIKRYKLTNK